MIGRCVTPVAASSNRITVTRSGSSVAEFAVVSRHVRGVQAGELVRLFEDRGQLWVVAILGTGPVADVFVSEPPTPETADAIGGTEIIAPGWSGTFRGGRWRGDTSHLIQGDGGWGRSWGAAFLPEKVRQLGTLSNGRLRVERLSYGTYAVQQPRILLLGGPKAATFPPVLATAMGPGLGSPGSVAQWSVPAEWTSQIETGAATGFGIGIDADTPYMRLDGPELLFTVDWSRTNI